MHGRLVQRVRFVYPAIQLIRVGLCYGIILLTMDFPFKGLLRTVFGLSVHALVHVELVQLIRLVHPIVRFIRVG